MAAPGSAPISILLESTKGSSTVATDALLGAMLRAHDQVSDLIFSPGRLPHVEIHGQLTAVQGPGLPALSADDTRRIASDLIGNNKQAIARLREQGSCDVSFGLPGVARFRVNVFIQRGSCAVVMRVIPTAIPDLNTLGLPAHLAEISALRDGIVLVTGLRGSGKSSTLAALLDLINREAVRHIITIEDPIEFLHNHKRATVHQRELHSDTPSMSLALQAALRQAPDVIFVSELRDRETIETALEAAETGHLVLSSLNTPDAAKTVERIVNGFPAAEQAGIRSRFAKTARYIISQKLIPRQDGRGRVPVAEILKVAPGTLEFTAENGFSGRSILEILKAGASQGMQHFDGEIEKVVRTGVVDRATAMTYASDAEQLSRSLGDVRL